VHDWAFASPLAEASRGVQPSEQQPNQLTSAGRRKKEAT